MSRYAHGWAIKWRSENRLDGITERLVGRFGQALLQVPPELAGYTTMLVLTRDAAREHIRKHYGYIRARPDLRKEPHGWKMPVPVKARAEIQERLL